MRILRSAIIFAVLLLGCCGGEGSTGPGQGESTVTARDGGRYNSGGRVVRVEFDGHTYVVFREGVSHGVGVAAVHDPDCRKCKP